MNIYLFMGLSDLFLVLLMIMYFLRFRDPIISQRRWEPSLVFAAVCLVHFQVMNIYDYQQNLGNTPSCHLLLWTSTLFVPLYAGVSGCERKREGGRGREKGERKKKVEEN